MTTDELEQRLHAMVAERPGSRFAEMVLRLPDSLRPAEVFEALVRLAGRGDLHSSGAGTAERPTAVKYYPGRTR